MKEHSSSVKATIEMLRKAAQETANLANALENAQKVVYCPWNHPYAEHPLLGPEIKVSDKDAISDRITIEKCVHELKPFSFVIYADRCKKTGVWFVKPCTLNLPIEF